MLFSTRRTAGLAALLSAGALALAPATAQAVADPDAVPAAACTPAVTPTSVSIGKVSTSATFDVTGCGTVGWTVVDQDSNGPTFLAYQGHASVTFRTADLFNTDAGPETVGVLAYSDAFDGTKIYDGTTKISFLRRSYWPSFNASPEPVKKGAKMKVTAKLDRIDWDAVKYAGYGGRIVHLQRKLPGGSYEDYKTYTLDSTGHLDTTITASSTATWRMRYAGNSVTGGSTSPGDTVAVN